MNGGEDKNGNNRNMAEADPLSYLVDSIEKMLRKVCLELLLQWNRFVKLVNFKSISLADFKTVLQTPLYEVWQRAWEKVYNLYEDNCMIDHPTCVWFPTEDFLINPLEANRSIKGDNTAENEVVSVEDFGKTIVSFSPTTFPENTEFITIKDTYNTKVRAPVITLYNVAYIWDFEEIETPCCQADRIYLLLDDFLLQAPLPNLPWDAETIPLEEQQVTPDEEIDERYIFLPCLETMASWTYSCLIKEIISRWREKQFDIASYLQYPAAYYLPPTVPIPIPSENPHTYHALCGACFKELKFIYEGIVSKYDGIITYKLKFLEE